LFGSIAPDSDYCYLHLFDEQCLDHHYYITHYPIFWAILLAGSALWLVSDKKSQAPVLVFMFSLNGLIHMFLDIVPNKIFWFAPFSYRGFSVNALLKRVAPSIVEDHPSWSYTIEALIFMVAIYLFFGSRQSSKESAKSST
jgi:hypothetical protein